MSMPMSYKQTRTLRLLRYVLCIRTFVVELEDDESARHIYGDMHPGHQTSTACTCSRVICSLLKKTFNQFLSVFFLPHLQHIYNDYISIFFNQGCRLLKNQKLISQSTNLFINTSFIFMNRLKNYTIDQRYLLKCYIVTSDRELKKT